MRSLGRIAFTFPLALLVLFIGTASAEFTIDKNYHLINSTRVGRTAYDYTYQVNITNNGSDLQNVTSTVSSSSPNTTIIDGNVTFGNIAAGVTVTSADTFTIRQNRTYAFDPDSLSWDVKYSAPSFTSIGVNAGLSVINIPIGSSENVAFTVDFESDNSNTYHTDFTQNISPNNNGIALSVDFETSWTTTSSKTWVVNEQITGNTVGTYEITSYAQIGETGQFAKVPITVNVLPNESTPEFKALTSIPDAINTNVNINVLFTMQLVGTDDAPNLVTLHQVDEFGSQISLLGTLNDTGISGDLLKGDNVYSGSFMIVSSELGGLFFKASASFSGGIVIYSNIHKLIVTDFPTEIVESDMSKIVIDPKSGGDIISNEILVTFEDGTNHDDIKLILDSISGTIVGTTAGVKTFQVTIPDTGNANGVNNAIESLLNNSQVLSAEPVNVGKTGAITPNDPDFNKQWGLEKIRADEAWVISRGSALIAVLDTGVDYDHPDLNSKVIKGKDYINNDEDPKDDQGHGTHVAGIVAANTNNSTGVAGASWNSKVIAVKVCDNAGNCPKSAVADGIRYAADKGAKIINMSLSYDFDVAFKLIPWPLSPYFMLVPTDSALKKAVDYAASKGCLVVVAAGNDGNSWKNYPAAYTNAFSVGSTTSTDGRSSFSCYGSWVNIAAPGSGIYSTLPTYNVTFNNAPFNYNKNYDSLSGTSMASPMVAGASAVVWAKYPSWSAAQVRERIERTAKPLPGLELGAGRIDLFEAVFNGSFETGDLSGWSKTGTASSLSSLGPITPQNKNGHKERFGYISTGPAADYISSRLSQTFNIQSGISSLPISFDYNFLTEEYPEFVGSIFDDNVTITMKTPSGSIQTLATESVNGSSFSSVSGIDFPGGDNTVGMTGWKSTTVNVQVTEGAGTYQIFIEDAGDDVYDSVILIDNVRFK